MQTRALQGQQTWAQSINEYFRDPVESACHRDYGTDEAFLGGRHSPLTTSGEAGSQELQLADGVGVLATAHDKGGTVVFDVEPGTGRGCSNSGKRNVLWSLHDDDVGKTGCNTAEAGRKYNKTDHENKAFLSRLGPENVETRKRLFAEWCKPTASRLEVSWLSKLDEPHRR